MGQRRWYEDSFKEQAVRLVTEQGYSHAQAAERLGVNVWTLREWVRKETRSGHATVDDATAVGPQEFKRLREENKRLRMENEILKKSHSVLRQGQPVKYAWIREHASEFPVAVMCRVLAVSSSGYYGWRERAPSAQQRRHESLKDAVEEAHWASKRVYGYRKVHQDVVELHGLLCCRETVRKVMQECGLRATHKRRFVVTTESGHGYPVAPNLLSRDFEPAGPNQKWVADITYIATREGWLYLAAVMDLFGRRLVGWATSDRIDAALVTEALNMAVRRRRPGPDLLHHSDQGSQYASAAFRQLLNVHGITASMSRKGNCWDNACMERFFASLKGEWLGDTIFPDRQAATLAIFEYVEGFYNIKRRHASLGYLTPAQYETAALLQGKHAA